MPELPPLNQRIKNLMNDKTGKTNRNVSLFAEMISEGRPKPIIQQRLDKIFDKQKPSTVASDIIEAILLKFPDIDAFWLITGQKKSGSFKPDRYLQTLMRNEIDAIKISLLKLSDLVLSEQEESSVQEVTYNHSVEGKTPLTDKR